jgi:hypothetical protein
MLLTSEIVRAARAREHRYVLSDGHGMSLQVMPWGSKWWRFRYRFRHAETMISLGVYPRVTLATARRRLADARGLLARGIDPSADRKEHRAATAHTLEAVARDWLKGLEVLVAKGLVTADTLKDATRILERHIFPEHDRASFAKRAGSSSISSVPSGGFRQPARRHASSTWFPSLARRLRCCADFGRLRTRGGAAWV